MAIDLKKMRAKLDTLQNRGGDKKSNFWRPKDGEQTLRIVPTADGDPFKDFHFHYLEVNGQRKSVLCPKKNFGDSCSICDFASSLYREGTPDSIKQAKGLFARQRFFSPVLVRGEEESGVRIWGYGKMAYESLLNLVLNPDYGDITDTDEGTDLNIIYGKPAGASFPQTKIQPRRRTSPLCDDAVGGSDKWAELLENIPSFDGLFDRQTSAQVETILESYLNGEDADAEDSSSETVKYTQSDSASNVEQAFEELMGAQ